MTVETGRIVEFEPGAFATTLPPCTLAALRHVLLPEVPVVWVVRHWPHDLGWWDAELPLAAGGPARRVRVRDVEFDLECATAEFPRLLPELADGGIVLNQMDRPVPDTLDYHRLDERERHRVLRTNGWRLTFHQHARGDYASVSAPDRATLERVLAEPVIRSGNLP